MGRGTISSDDGQGLYTVNFDYGTVGQGEVLDQLDAEIDRLNTSITENELLIPEFAAVIAYWTAQQNAAINAYNADKTDENKTQLKATTTGLAKAVKAKERTIAALNSLKLSLANTEQRRDYVAALPVTETKSVWCVDYTTQATGEVSTIEINGEPPLTLIAPGAAAYSTDYGRMHSDQLIGYSATYFNAAILPGWQKFKPTYRTGVITSINRAENTCDLDLDPAMSSAQGLDINQASSLSGVTFEYMTCDHAAFNTGDDVVIKFEGQDWNNPKVIGFKENPKQCAPARVFFYVEPDKKVATRPEGPAVIPAYGTLGFPFEVESMTYRPPSAGGGEGYLVEYAPTITRSETEVETDFRYINERFGPDSYDYVGAHPALDPPVPDWEPLYAVDVERYHRDVVIRTDVYWYQQNLGDRLLDRYQSDGLPPLYLTDGRVKIDGDYYSMDEFNNDILRRYDVQCIADNNDMTVEILGGEWRTEVTDPVSVPTKTVPVWYFYFAVDDKIVYFGDASGPDIGPYDTTVIDNHTIVKERYQITPDSIYQVVDENDEQIEIDLATRHATLMEKWPMPETIEIEINGVFHEYKLELFGVQPSDNKPTVAGTWPEYNKTVRPADPPVEWYGFNNDLPVTTDYDVGNYWRRRIDGGELWPVNTLFGVTYIRADLAD